MAPDSADTRHRVVAGILVRECQVLLCHRAGGRAWYPDVWDFPGGHVETGETPPEALVRELREELGVAVALPPDEEFARLQTSDFDCLFWVIAVWVGTPANTAENEHDQLAWWPGEAIGGLRLAHEDYPALIGRALSA